jgi:hypothetical protein
LETITQHEQLPKDRLVSWLKERLDLTKEYIDLFDIANDSLEVRTHDCGGKTVLSKSLVMCSRYGEVIQSIKSNPESDGIIYFMYRLSGEEPVVHYVGKAARKGTRRPVSSNMNANPHYQFARWGCRNEWHLGGLSDWLLRGRGSNNERTWSQNLFVSATPPMLRDRI